MLGRLFKDALKGPRNTREQPSRVGSVPSRKDDVEVQQAVASDPQGDRSYLAPDERNPVQADNFSSEPSDEDGVLPLTVENLAKLNELKLLQDDFHSLGWRQTLTWDQKEAIGGSKWSRVTPSAVGEGIHSTPVSATTSQNPSIALSETLYEGSAMTEDSNNLNAITSKQNPESLIDTSPSNGGLPPLKPDKPRPYTCETCSRSFARMEHLKRHERSHTKPKPFECTECTRCFARRDLLLRHMAKLHPDRSSLRPKSNPIESTGSPFDLSVSMPPSSPTSFSLKPIEGLSPSQENSIDPLFPSDEWSGMYCTPPMLRSMSRAASVTSALSSAKSIARSIRSILGSPFAASSQSLQAFEKITEAPAEAKRKRRRESHNRVERRRRDNINERILELKNLTPSHRMENKEVREPMDELSATRSPTDLKSYPLLTVLEKGPNKGDILSGAVGWIKDLIWMSLVAVQTEHQLRTLVVELGGTVPDLPYKPETLQMRSELIAAVNQNNTSLFSYSRVLGNGLRVPDFTTIDGTVLKDINLNLIWEKQNDALERMLENAGIKTSAPITEEQRDILIPPTVAENLDKPQKEFDSQDPGPDSFDLKSSAAPSNDTRSRDTKPPDEAGKVLLVNSPSIPANSWFIIAGMISIFTITLEWRLGNEPGQTESWRISSNIGEILRSWIELTLDMWSYKRIKDPLKTRIAWRCKCGKQLYDDFKELQPGALAKLEERLRKSNEQTTTRDKSNGIGGIWSILGVLRSLLRTSRKNQRLAQDSSLPRHESQIDSTQHPIPKSQTQEEDIADLHLCIKAGRYATKLVYLDVHSISTDQQLFNEMKRRRDGLASKFQSLFSLYNLRTIKFVKFVMHKMELVDVKKEDDIPPSDKLAEYKYQYDPIPPEYVPPVGENHLMHLYLNPACANDEHSTLLSLFPKKVYERLMLCQKTGMTTGWGVHFVEGWNWDQIWSLSIVLLVLGGIVFAVAWTLLEHDIQGAFSVASYLTALLALAMGLVQVKSLPKG